MKTKALLLATFSAVIVAAPAFGQDAKPRDHYRFAATAPAAFENGEMTFEPATEGALVRATEKTATWSGRARQDGRLVTITRGATAGMARLVESGTAPVGSIEYVALFDEKFEKADIRIYRTAGAERTEIGSGRLDGGKRRWERLPGDLLAIARKEVDRAIHDERAFSEEFSVLTYGHIGIRTGVDLLTDAERTPLMKEGDRLFRETRHAEPVWIRTFVEGGPRIAYSISVPIDSSGTVRVDAGFQLGARLAYTCEEPYARPEGITDGKGILDAIESVPVRTFTLPLDADKALAMPVGTRRTLAGNGMLAINGGVSLGYRLEELGVLKDKAEVGLYGGLGVTWSINGDVQLFVQRETGSNVRMRWTRATHRAFSGGVNALIGAYVNEKVANVVAANLGTAGLSGSLGAAASSGVKAIIREGRKYTTIEFGIGGGKQDDKQLDIEMLFDLSESRSRTAYEAAVRGDLTKVQDLAAANDPGGLKEYRITSTLTDALTFNASFKAFEVLNYHGDSRTAHVRVDVESLDGTTSTTDTYSYAKHSHGLFGGDRSLAAEAIDRTVVHPSGPTSKGQRITFHFEQVEDRTSRDEVDASLALAARLFGEPAVAADRAKIEGSRPYDKSRPFLALTNGNEYKKTKLAIDVALGTRSIEKVLAASDADFLLAYGHASGDDAFEWTPARLAVVKKTSLAPLDKEHENDAVAQQLRHEAWALDGAKPVLKLLQKARGAATSQERVESFRKLAKSDGFKMRAVLALSILANKDDCRTALVLQGDRVSLSYAAGDAAPLPVHP